MTKKSCLPVLLAMLLAAGCASAPEQKAAPHDNTVFFLSSYDKVWDALTATLEEDSIPIDTMDWSEGLITTGFINYSVGQKTHRELSTIAVKPAEPRLAIWSQAGYTLSIRLESVSDLSTKVQVTAHIEAHNQNVTGQWHECASKGVLERKLLERVKARL
ncbi:MAG: hypothetical protein WAR22_05140 [Desulfomonilia bacterium]|jgi:hypothetical protein